MADWLVNNLGLSINDVAKAVRSGNELLLAEFDLSFLDFIVLINCYEGPENTVTGIANHTDYDAGRISRAVEQLVRRGLIQRQRLPDDRRVVELSLTDAGQALAPTVLGRVLGGNASLLEGVTYEERVVFATVTRKIIANGAAMQSE